MRSLRRLLFCLCLPLLAAGCAAPPPVAPDGVFSDAAFRPPSEAVSASAAFELSAPMRTYLNSAEFRDQIRRHGPERGLVNALYKKGELKLDYDASVTRTAAETFAARTGNCLSLVLMTAAFAKALDLDVQYNDVAIDNLWTRTPGLYFASTHVNLSLLRKKDWLLRTTSRIVSPLTVDFLPPEQSAGDHHRKLEEEEIVAMYLNNRAAEALAAERVDDAYWWAKASIAHHPVGANGYNTLGVVYQRKGNQVMAERAFRGALTLDKDSTTVMHNLVRVLKELGKNDESLAMAHRLAELEPIPPFFYFDKGMAAMAKSNFTEARTLFGKEVRRSPSNHEFHFWLAQAHLSLGNTHAARDELKLALEHSTTRTIGERYSAKLAHLRSRASAVGTN